MRRWCFRLGLLASVAWFVGTLAVIFGRSDPADLDYRLEASRYRTGTMRYMGCGESGPQGLDFSEKIDLHYLETMAEVYSKLADWRGEPVDWSIQDAMAFLRQRRCVIARLGQVEATAMTATAGHARIAHGQGKWGLAHGPAGS
jgi:hypothetical protein